MQEPVAPVLCATLPAAICVASHYFPWRFWFRRGRLPRLLAYSLGLLSILLPATIAMLYAAQTAQEAALLLWLAAVSAGVGTVPEAIALVPARVDTQWWKTLTDRCTFFCFVEGRLSFGGNDGGNAPFPSALVYFGQNCGAFYYTFGEIGRVCKIVTPDDFGE